NKINAEDDDPLPEGKVDLAENRRRRREARDSVEKSAASMANPGTKEFAYSEELSDAEKFHIAYKHLELLGQVLRNFPGSLPGPEKLAILESTYLLGLRLLTVLFRFFQFSFQDYAEVVKKAAMEDRSAIDENQAREFVDRLIVFLNRIVVLSLL